MMKKKLCGFIIAGLLIATQAVATPLDLWQAWQLAQQHDPIYAAQRAQTQASQEQIAQARARLFPAVDAVAGITHNDTRRASRLNQSSDTRVNQWQLRLSQPLFDLSAIAQFERSRYLASIAVFDLENAKHELMLRVAQTYFAILSAQDNLRSLQSQKQAIEQQLAAAQQNFALGGATITDTYEAQSRLDLLNAQLVIAENTLTTEKNQLSRILGRPVQHIAPLHHQATLPTPEPLDPHAWVQQASLGNLSLMRASLAMQAQQYQLKADQHEHAPTVTLQARSGSQSNMGVSGPNTSPRSLDSSIGVELSIPLYQGGAIASRVRENASLLQQKHYEQENARRQAEEQVRSYFSGVLAGLHEVKALEAAEKSSRAAWEANQTAYEIGVRINIDVLNAQQQLYETQRALAQARYNTLLQGLRLKQAAGLLRAEDIAALNTLLAPANPSLMQ